MTTHQHKTKQIASVRFSDYAAARQFRDQMQTDARVRIRRRAGGVFEVVTYAAIAVKP